LSGCRQRSTERGSEEGYNIGEAGAGYPLAPTAGENRAETSGFLCEFGSGCGCLDSAGAGQPRVIQHNMGVPVLNSISPSTAVAGAGSPPVVITATGSGITDDATLLWNGFTLASEFISDTEITATIPAAYLARPGVAIITISQAGGTSGPPTLAPTNPPATAAVIAAAVEFITTGLEDLTTLAAMKAFIQNMAPTPTPDDNLIQAMISAASADILWRTGRSSFNRISTFTERYDGSGSNTLYLNERPITAVISLQVGTQVIPPSLDGLKYGFIIDQDGANIAIVGTTAFANLAGWFWRGTQNVLVSYTAGYDSTPFDIEEACQMIVTQNFGRRGYVDQMSKALPQGGGTINFLTRLDIPPYAKKAIGNYKRMTR
jgi:IPT/TIG domain-containing protein